MRMACRRHPGGTLLTAAATALCLAGAGLAGAAAPPAQASAGPRVLAAKRRLPRRRRRNGENCQGGVYLIPPGAPGQAPLCYFQALGNQVLGNSFAGNGRFGNPSNGDVALLTTPSTDLAPPHQVYSADCFANNTDPGGFTSDPPAAQSDPLLACGKPSPGSPDPALVVQAECAAQLFAACPAVPAPSAGTRRPANPWKKVPDEKIIPAAPGLVHRRQGHPGGRAAAGHGHLGQRRAYCGSGGTRHHPRPLHEGGPGLWW